MEKTKINPSDLQRECVSYALRIHIYNTENLIDVLEQLLHI